MWLTPTNLSSLPEFGIAFDVHSSPFLASLPSIFPIYLELPEHLEFLQGEVSKLKSRHHNEFCRPITEFAVQAVGHAEFSAVLAWSPCDTSCPLPPGLVSFVVSDTISSSEMRKKKSLFPCGFYYLSHTWTVASSTFTSCMSEAPLECSRRWLGKKTGPTVSLVSVIK